MHALAPNRESHVNTIIDEQGNVVSSAYLVKLFRYGNEIACIRCLVTVLDNGDS
jgi:hypothetical protein